MIELSQLEEIEKRLVEKMKDKLNKSKYSRHVLRGTVGEDIYMRNTYTDIRKIAMRLLKSAIKDLRREATEENSYKSGSAGLI